ncbi:MAG: molecular chaperone DnaK [Actinobacteria bacterium]|nr:molecular chaperone DnaK [Actinomycetota bacterium]MSW57702.1 molecular chaperone DnaK [Actinomycetota bacterium]MSX48456.1 molecular chaperone DnaK [Actinomycetota bacterium]MSX62110.1 molecular chaperone DnaK [Actinomycetota bacterium]MSY10422.1 molecular chaperone DnaK [Actinomycetota bacterium]
MRAVVKKIAKKAPAKKAPAKKAPAKKVPAKKAPAKKAPAKKAAVKKAPAKKAAVKKAPGKPFPAKAAVAVAPAPVIAAPVVPVVAEERRLVMPPPPRPVKNGKKAAPLKPIKSAPTPVVVSENESPWSAAELKTMKSELAKELLRLKAELVAVENEMDELIHESGEGAGDDQADAGTKTFEREHEMSLVINARDMVLQTERALERIEEKTYGQCEECGNAIGKARLQVFPRATLCMVCKAKEERR